MQSVVDVNADVVWLAVTAESTAKGIIEHKPQTDDDWVKVRHGAIALMEAFESAEDAPAVTWPSCR
jgi:hypothetical protein